MDNFTKAADLIKAYHKYKKSDEVADFIKISCDYFDAIKNKDLSESDIKFLMFISNEVGLPQYFDMLQDKYQHKRLEVLDVNLSTLGAYISESSLYVSSTKLHRYQKEVLEHFITSRDNRFILSAPTSFGKTFLVYQVIKKMNYQNIVLIFPTISLLSENYSKLLSDDSEYSFFCDYQINTLSDVDSEGQKNIWIYTPERFLSYIDKNNLAKFDFIFIDEVYKIDNEYIIDKETTGENERDTAYRLALEFACRKSKDMLLAGPYMEFPEKNDLIINHSFNNFVQDKGFSILNYNKFELVNKTYDLIKNKKSYIIDGKCINIGKISKYEKVANIIQSITTPTENTIVYCSTKASTEKYAREMIVSVDFTLVSQKMSDSSQENRIFNEFIEHLENLFGNDWVVVEALRHRIGIHHGLIPKYIQKEIISLFNDGLLYCLISTTTITEGVNTTAKNIIINENKKGTKLLRHFDAKNIAGRAGRFSHHYTGRVIVIDNNFKETLENDGEYLKHKNFDLTSVKTDVDYFITSDKYLNSDDSEKKTGLHVNCQRGEFQKALAINLKLLAH